MSSWNTRYSKRRIVNTPIVQETPQIVETPKIPNTIKNIITEPVRSYLSTNIDVLTVIFISNIQSGGAKKYIDDIISNFKSNFINFKVISSKSALESIKPLKSSDIIFFQHLIYTDLDLDDLIQIKQKYNCKLLVTLHDFYLLKDDYHHYNPLLHSLYLENVSPIKSHQDFLNVVDQVIAPSQFVLDGIKRVYNITSGIVSPHIDRLSKDVHNYIPLIIDSTINIAVPHEFSEYKGKEFYLEIFNEIKCINVNDINYEIKYHIFPKSYDPVVATFASFENIIIHPEYNEDELYTILQSNNIHLLTYLNKWGETYCYSLTKGLNSGLPILYNNIGALKERIDSNNEYYFPIDKEDDDKIVKYENIQTQLFNALKFIINNQTCTQSKINTYLDIPTYYYNLFNSHYLNYFNKKYKLNIHNYLKLNKLIEPFAIYFPQFHEIEENNLTYYKGFTDLVNLKKIIESDDKNKFNFRTPLNGLLGYYDLKLSTITMTQVAIAKAYGIKGFAMYYYWFSDNTVTNEQHIMKDVIDKFFEKSLDFEIFFIFANEGWSNNPAFSTTNLHTIKNDYSIENIFAFCEDLIPYFKHNNYKKVDNKPVLLLHHPWELSQKQLKLFRAALDVICIDNDFDGIHLIINSMNGINDGFLHYSHHPEYKNRIDSIIWKNEHTVINYDDYVNKYVGSTAKENNSIIKGCFTNFNNYVRLYYSKMRDSIYTSTESNSDLLFSKFIQKQTKNYKNKQPSINKIFLLNSWNEWGEQMAIEPSNEDGFKLLDIIHNELISLL